MDWAGLFQKNGKRMALFGETYRICTEYVFRPPGTEKGVVCRIVENVDHSFSFLLSHYPQYPDTAVPYRPSVNIFGTPEEALEGMLGVFEMQDKEGQPESVKWIEQTPW